MGKGGGSSCLKIMACGRDPEGNGEEGAAEAQIAPEKRKWSFRRRSSKNQVLSNISISGPLSAESYSKGSPEACINNPNESNVSLASEGSPIYKLIEEKPALPPVTVNPVVLHDATVSIEKKDVDRSYQNSVATTIQSAARRYLARKELIKLKYVVMLQAFIRGYLVRRQAVGTLRCVQAILKLQVLIRFRAHNCSEKFRNLEARGSLGNKPKKVQCSTEKLHANAFTRQLLASTPMKRPIYISCDPSKSASAWQWLERWMSLASPDVGQVHELAENKEFEDHSVKDAELIVSEASAAVHTDPHVSEPQVPIMHIPNHCSHPDPHDLKSAQARKSHEATEKEAPLPSSNNIIMEEISSPTSNQMKVKSDVIVQTEVHNEKHVIDIEKSKRTTKRMSSEHPENESRSLAVPKRSCNPAFAAMQSKFEELSAVPNATRSFSGKALGPLQVTVTESKGDLLHSVAKAENVSNQIEKSDVCSPEAALSVKTEANINEANISHQTQLQTAVSECGTEISISSTLDSPDRSEAEGGEIVLDIGTLEKRHFDTNGNYNGACVLDWTDPETNGSSIAPRTLERGLLSTDSGANDRCEHKSLKSESKYISVIGEDLELQKKLAVEISGNIPSPVSLEKPPSVDLPEVDMHYQHETASGLREGLSSSVQASPRSQITAPESHGTPASQASAVTTSSKTRGNLPVKKLKPHIAGKRSSSNEIDSSGRDSVEHSQDSKSLKRRNSLGMVKPDFLDNEPRNSSSNALPNYMQATESAKAKLLASTSPKSSPDARETENHTKKRHSLPIGNGKQSVSPRMQRSASKVQQHSKENTKRSPNIAAERKWQR